MLNTLDSVIVATAATPSFDTADTVWLVVASTLVLLMTPALALFYGGMVNKRNVLNTMMMSFLMMGVVSLSWALWGFSIAFGDSSTGLFGSFQYAFLNGVSATEPMEGMTIPAALFMLFQMKFAIITPALISGAVVERIKWRGYVLFMLIWSTIVYAPVACWVWNGGGWLYRLGALDFAGGTVVHLASGVSALALCMVIGKRNFNGLPANNLTLTLLGAGMLWFGWIGFNAGSALALDGIAIGAFVATHLAAAAGMIGWMAVERMVGGRTTAVGCASGLVAGLVGITPAAGFVTPMGSIGIGLAAGGLCYLAVLAKHKMGYDDALDVVAVHGVGGLIGAILTGVLASPAANSAVTDALADGRGALILKQIGAVGAVGAYAFVVSIVLAFLLQKTVGLRVPPGVEESGLDETIHGESGYGIEALGGERETAGTTS